MTRPHILNFIIPAFLLILGANRAIAVAPEIKDDGKFFSADAVKKANAEIRAIARKYDKDVSSKLCHGPGQPARQGQSDEPRRARQVLFQICSPERTEAAVVRRSSRCRYWMRPPLTFVDISTPRKNRRRPRRAGHRMRPGQRRKPQLLSPLHHRHRRQRTSGLSPPKSILRVRLRRAVRMPRANRKRRPPRKRRRRCSFPMGNRFLENLATFTAHSIGMGAMSM